MDPPLELVERTFTCGCDLEITSLMPYLTGVELADLVPRLDAFPDKGTWSIRPRRALVAHSERDATLVRRQLESIALPVDVARTEYLDRTKSATARSLHGYTSTTPSA